ncbi:MAG: alkaline phosphatase D family protein [Solirubrobacteraceae bacterium]
MPELLLGPVLRYTDATCATVWVETADACEVEILGCREQTFCVYGRHYAIVAVEGLEPDSSNPYEVRLDGELVWPRPDYAFPPSVIRTIGSDRESLRICFGSCRVAVPHVPPWTLTKDTDDHGREVDALFVLARRMRDTDQHTWPDQLLLIGDQVYADEDAPRTREYIRARRDTSGEPGQHVQDFEEYGHLYGETWGGPNIRWLLSTVPSAMLFDDHDVHDDWNTSESWLEEMRSKPWWEEHIAAALSSYFVYQHVGNLSPEELRESTLLARIKAADDAGPLLRDWACEADKEVDGSRFSHARPLGRSTLVMLDSREGRVLTPDDRRIVDDKEWEWIEERATGGVDHLILADTLPMFFSPTFHHAEAFSEALAGGAWGTLMSKVAEKARRAFDLEHWAAFNHSFRKVSELVCSVSRGERGAPPASIVMLGGDVHHAYAARVHAGGDSAVWQAVCSPLRNPLQKTERRQARLGFNATLARLARGLARRAGVPDPPVGWTVTDGPFFDNQVATLEIHGRSAWLRVERTTDGGWRRPTLTTSLERRLA